MVVLFNSQRSWIPRNALICKSFSSKKNNFFDEKTKISKVKELAHVRYAIDVPLVCSWNSYIIACPVVENPQNFALTDTSKKSKSVSVMMLFNIFSLSKSCFF